MRGAARRRGGCIRGDRDWEVLGVLCAELQGAGGGQSCPEGGLRGTL